VCSSCPLIWVRRGLAGRGVLGHHPRTEPTTTHFYRFQPRNDASPLSTWRLAVPLTPFFCPYTPKRISFAFLTPSTPRRVSHFRQRKMAAITLNSAAVIHVGRIFFGKIKQFLVARRLKPGSFKLVFRSNQIRSKDYSRRVVTSTHASRD